MSSTIESRSAKAQSAPSLVERLQWSLKRRGFFGTVWASVARGPRCLHGILWDFGHGVETSEVVPIRQLQIDSTNVNLGIDYQPTPASVFHKIMRRLPVRLETYNFIDFGCGKGRVLFMATDYPLKKIIGIEFSPELHRT